MLNGLGQEKKIRVAKVIRHYCVRRACLFCLPRPAFATLFILLTIIFCAVTMARAENFTANETMAEYQEGDFWRDSKKEEEGYIVFEQNFSHIIYKDHMDRKWTRCHSCLLWLPLENAYKCIIDTREQTRRRLEWEFSSKENKTRTKPPVVMGIYNKEGIKILDYEELYYCNNCKHYCNSAE